MGANSVDASLAFAAELEERDAAVAEKLDVLARLGGRVDRVRERVESLAAFQERLPADREHLDTALADAERDIAATRAALVRAHEAVERARSEDARSTARRHEAHAATDLHTTEARRDRLVGRRETLSRESENAEVESTALADAVQELSTELASAPRVAAPAPPETGLDGLIEWAARAHASVFVARSGLETERERVVREANELAASVLGEPLYATSVATVRRRLSERLS